MFWRKNKDIVLNCYTDRPEVYNLYPITLSNKTKPAWFKNKSPRRDKNKITRLNIKGCRGFIDYYSKGVVLPLWSDLRITIGEKGTTSYEWEYADCCSHMSIHNTEDLEPQFPESEYKHLKIISPWCFTCDEDIDFLAIEPGWQFNILGFIRILKGVVNFKYQASTHINIFCVRGEREETIVLPAGMPIYHFIPLTTRKVTIKTHLVSAEELRKISVNDHPFKFAHSYLEKKRRLKEQECPYSR